MQDIQEKVQKFCDEHNLNTSPQSRLIDTVSELGEVAKELLVGSDYGKKSLEHNEKIELEIGDVVFSIIALSNSLDITFIVDNGVPRECAAAAACPPKETRTCSLEITS